MTRHNLLRFLGALLCLAGTSALAQQYTVKTIAFDGTMPYTQADLELASGLKSGDTITSATLQDAAQRLVVPEFDNFVWWQPSELAAELHKRVPLFNGTLPEAGNLQQSVQDALLQMLAEKQVAAADKIKIDCRIIHPGLGHPRRLVSYRIVSPDIRFASVTLDGVSPGNSAAITKLTSSLVNRPYSDESIDHLLNPYRNAGAIDARFSEITRSLAITPTRIDVTVAAKLTEGPPYRVSKLDFDGTTLVSKEQFAAEQTLHPGDVASQSALLKSLAVLDSAYRKLGYLDAAIDAVPTRDPLTHQVAYRITTVPGEQYRINTLTINNLSAGQRQQFNSAWKLQPGALYDSFYTAEFLKHSGVASLDTFSGAFIADADPDTHMVDLTINFFPGRQAN
jgi:outer membrane protein insertion porin family